MVELEYKCEQDIEVRLWIKRLRFVHLNLRILINVKIDDPQGVLDTIQDISIID